MSPSTTAFRSRSSIGSMPSSCASSSSSDSSANAAVGAPGARYAPKVKRFVWIPYPTMSCASQRYGPDDEGGRDPFDAPARVRAAVDEHARLDPGERAVLARADAKVRDLRRGRIRRLEVLAAGQDEAHGPPEREGGAGRERLDERELSAERASERLRDDANSLEREAECASELPPRHERALRARGDDERSRRLEPGRRDLGLDVRLIDPRRTECPRDDGVARFERGGGVAVLAMNAIEDVPGQLLLLGVLLPMVDARVDRLEVSAALGLLDEAGERRPGTHCRPRDRRRAGASRTRRRRPPRRPRRLPPSRRRRSRPAGRRRRPPRERVALRSGPCRSSPSGGRRR